ncbi:MAG: alpha/beta hydrolase family protein [Planctomycetaceae bacterium]
MKIPGLVVVAVVALSGSVLWAEGPAAAVQTIRRDVIYGHKDGMALTIDVITPPDANGSAVLYIQSGGWHSRWQEPQHFLAACQPLLERGITMVLVWHGSAPRYAIPEIFGDVQRAVRFVHLHSADFGIDEQRIGLLGGSAAGHLALLLAVTGDDGDPAATDEVLRASSRVAVVVTLYPVTDIRSWVTDPPEAVRKVPALKPPLTFDPKRAAEFSPALRVTAQAPPILLIHGAKDELVPVEHSRQMYAALQAEGVRSELVVIEDAVHGFNAQQNLQVVPRMTGWFERHLQPAVGATR